MLTRVQRIPCYVLVVLLPFAGGCSSTLNCVDGESPGTVAIVWGGIAGAAAGVGAAVMGASDRVAAGIGVLVAVIVGGTTYAIKKEAADAREKAAAEASARQKMEQMTQQRLDELRAQNQMLLVRVDDLARVQTAPPAPSQAPGATQAQPSPAPAPAAAPAAADATQARVMMVDPKTGEPVGDSVYTIDTAKLNDGETIQVDEYSAVFIS